LTAVLVSHGVHSGTGFTGAVRVRAAEPASPTVAAVHSALPAPADAKRILNTTTRHREWAAVPVDGRSILAWMVYPERSDKAPVVILTGDARDPSDWLRAISDQLAAEGFIAMAPGAAANARDTAAVRDYATGLPS